MNLVTTYLVLAAGTGSDHQLSKWSTKACERYTGLGKPRAKTAVEELVRHGLIQYTDASTKAFPQYRLQAIPPDRDPIFLPVALVTGLTTEASILRRVREVGDALLLRMLVDLYGMSQMDATFGVPIAALRQIPEDAYPSRKAFEIGVHSIWALRLSGTKSASGEWTQIHKSTDQEKEDWTDFWARVELLFRIGAIYYEPWIFDSATLDAEPLFPVSYGTTFNSADDEDVINLTQTMFDTVNALAGERAYILERYADDILVPFSSHRQMPSIIGVARMRIEADTPGRRYSYQKRKSQMETYSLGYSQVMRDVAKDDFSKPLNTSSSR